MAKIFVDVSSEFKRLEKDVASNHNFVAPIGSCFVFNSTPKLSPRSNLLREHKVFSIFLSSLLLLLWKTMWDISIRTWNNKNFFTWTAKQHWNCWKCASAANYYPNEFPSIHQRGDTKITNLNFFCFDFSQSVAESYTLLVNWSLKSKKEVSIAQKGKEG